MRKQIKTLDFTIEARSAVPVYEQVKQAIKLAVISGYLQEDDQLMSIRELGGRLKIHPNTISKVYYQLEMEGFIYARQGTGYFVKAAPEKLQKEKRELFKKVTREYISKAIRLGYSADEMLEELKTMVNEMDPGKKKEENDDNN
jgi:GntR family transcriptional regulator